MDNSSVCSAKFTAVGVRVQMQKLVFPGDAAFGNVKDEGRWRFEEQGTAVAADDAHHLALEDTGTGVMLEGALSLEVDDFGSDLLPLEAVFAEIVDADAVHACGQSAHWEDEPAGRAAGWSLIHRCGWCCRCGSRNAGRLDDDCGYFLVRCAGLFK